MQIAIESQHTTVVQLLIVLLYDEWLCDLFPVVFNCIKWRGLIGDSTSTLLYQQETNSTQKHWIQQADVIFRCSRCRDCLWWQWFGMHSPERRRLDCHLGQSSGPNSMVMELRFGTLSKSSTPAALLLININIVALLDEGSLGRNVDHFPPSSTSFSQCIVALSSSDTK